MKIGYQAGIKLLRAGAQLDRHDALPARRGGAVRAGARLRRVGRPARDLRPRPAPHAERRGVLPRTSLETRDRLDFIVNNACQTVRRPPDFYRHMLERETASRARRCRPRCAAARRLRGAAPLRHAPGRRPPLARRGRAGRHHARGRAVAGAAPRRRTSPAQGDLFPEGRLDQDLQQVDLRDRNSWRLLLAEVPSVELLETQLVNAVAPFVLNARLKPLMLRTPERDKHIVNVSAVEGQFYRRFKTTRHPHTNMAKAALNMMTRTSAADYQADGIHMNSVDTGWVTDEDPVHIAEQKTAEHRLPPAARHRRRRRAHRRSDHRRLQHRRARLGPVPEGLPADRLVSSPGFAACRPSPRPR